MREEKKSSYQSSQHESNFHVQSAREWQTWDWAIKNRYAEIITLRMNSLSMKGGDWNCYFWIINWVIFLDTSYLDAWLLHIFHFLAFFFPLKLKISLSIHEKAWIYYRPLNNLRQWHNRVKIKTNEQCNYRHYVRFLPTY